MNRAALRQQETYKKNLSRSSNITEKEKYAQRIEQQKTANAIYGGSDGGAPKQPLGKYVSQLEMKDPEARKRLKEMLEFQMNEKRTQDVQGARLKIRSIKAGKPPMMPPQSQLALQSVPAAGQLPPLQLRNASPGPLAQSAAMNLTPSRRNQGYIGLSQANGVSPLRGSGSMQMLPAAGLQGQRYNDLMALGPGQEQPGLRSYGSQPQLAPLSRQQNSYGMAADLQ